MTNVHTKQLDTWKYKQIQLYTWKYKQIQLYTWKSTISIKGFLSFPDIVESELETRKQA